MRGDIYRFIATVTRGNPALMQVVFDRDGLHHVQLRRCRLSYGPVHAANLLVQLLEYDGPQRPQLLLQQLNSALLIDALLATLAQHRTVLDQVLQFGDAPILALFYL